MKTQSIITAGIALTAIALFSIPVEAMDELETPVRKVPIQRRAQINRADLLDSQRREFAEDSSANRKLNKLGQAMVRERNFVARGYQEPRPAHEWFTEYSGL